ncbi:MAG: aldehyde dehydrogenase family protein, partial [Spirochaetota bacterium]
WGKFLNAGQTCIAPDYLLVHKNIKDELMTALENELKAFYGSDPSKSADYCRIVNQRQFDKLVEMLGDPENVAIGGEYNREDLYFAPTVLHNVNREHPSMKGEIFGPILPVLTYETLDEAIDMVKNHTKPLALYVFTRNKKTWKRIINETSFGGGCVNETLSHIVSPHLPFGGVGHSGMGRYHGKSSFDTFTNYKSVLKKPWFPDLFLRYPPYKKYRFGLLKKYFRI